MKLSASGKRWSCLNTSEQYQELHSPQMELKQSRGFVRLELSNLRKMIRLPFFCIQHQKLWRSQFITYYLRIDLIIVYWIEVKWNTESKWNETTVQWVHLIRTWALCVSVANRMSEAERSTFTRPSARENTTSFGCLLGHVMAVTWSWIINCHNCRLEVRNSKLIKSSGTITIIYNYT